jgi:hypothetical protein
MRDREEKTEKTRGRRFPMRNKISIEFIVDSRVLFWIFVPIHICFIYLYHNLQNLR